jgi:hypothetical protein
MSIVFRRFVLPRTDFGNHGHVTQGATAENHMQVCAFRDGARSCWKCLSPASPTYRNPRNGDINSGFWRALLCVCLDIFCLLLVYKRATGANLCRSAMSACQTQRLLLRHEQASQTFSAHFGRIVCSSARLERILRRFPSPRQNAIQRDAVNRGENPGSKHESARGLS